MSRPANTGPSLGIVALVVIICGLLFALATSYFSFLAVTVGKSMNGEPHGQEVNKTVDIRREYETARRLNPPPPRGDNEPTREP